MSSISTDVGRRFFDSPGHQVYVRQKWTDNWTLAPDLYAVEVQAVAAPSIGRARLVRDYGQVLKPAADQFASVGVTNYVGYWVKVVIDQPADFVSGDPREPDRWHGRIWEQPDERRGTFADTLQGIPDEGVSGVEHYTAYELLFELSRQYIRSSVVETSDGEQTIGRAIAFNRSKGDVHETPFDVRGNRSQEDGEKETKIFARDLKDAELWTASDIVKYLLAYHTANDQNGEPEVEWEYNPGGADFLVWHKPAVDCQGATIKQILDGLIDRRLLSGYCVEVQNDEAEDETSPGERVIVRPFTFAVEPITVYDDTTLPANESQKTLDFDSSFDVDEAIATTSLLHKVERVRVIGGRVSVVMTLAALDETLDKHWTSDQQSDYNAAASGEPGYSSLKRPEKELANDRFRMRDELRRVFRYFGLPDNWDGQVGDGVGGAKHPAKPKFDPTTGQPTAESSPFWQAGIRFESQLPLRTDIDYVKADLEPGDLTDNRPPGGEPEFKTPFAAIKVENDAEDNEKYMPIGDLGIGRVEGEYDGGRGWSAAVRMQLQGAGVVVNVQGSNTPAAQHSIAKADFVKRPKSECEEIDADLDWQDNLLVTVHWLTDDFVEAVWPEDNDLGEADVIREKLIKLGDDFRLVYVAPGTVVDVKDGDLKRTDNGGFIHDDRERMKGLAKIAWEWYKRPRRAFSLSYRQVLKIASIGDMITRIGPDDDSTQVNTVVTAISIDLVGQRTTLSTDFGEIDVAGLQKPKNLAERSGRLA